MISFSLLGSRLVSLHVLQKITFGYLPKCLPMIVTGNRLDKHTYPVIFKSPDRPHPCWPNAVMASLVRPTLLSGMRLLTKRFQYRTRQSSSHHRQRATENSYRNPGRLHRYICSPTAQGEKKEESPHTKPSIGSRLNQMLVALT